MSALKFYLLGNVALQGALSRPIHFPTKKSKSLFAYLVVYKERTFTRAALAGKFWPEIEDVRAQRSLNTEIWRLRTMLKSSGLEPDNFLFSDRDRVGFCRDSDHWVDVAEFHALTQSVTVRSVVPSHPHLLPSLRRAIVLYRGDFADGLFDEWCLVQREDYRVRLLAALETLLAAAMDEEHWDEGIAHGRRLLELDPLQEHVHRALMRCHFGLGNRPAALKQYGACERVLRDELQIEPMPETRQLFEKLAAQTTAQEQPSDVRDPLDPILRSCCTPAQRIDAALANLSTARSLLEDASRQLLTAASDRRAR